MGIQLTYCNIETEQIRRFRQAKTREELEEWFQGLIHEYVKWARYLYHHSIRRTECLKELQFPYAYRKVRKNWRFLYTEVLPEGEIFTYRRYRDRKNLILCLSRPESYRRRLWGEAVLSHSQDYY